MNTTQQLSLKYLSELFAEKTIAVNGEIYSVDGLKGWSIKSAKNDVLTLEYLLSPVDATEER